MAQYRKKPVVINAERFDPPFIPDGLGPLPEHIDKHAVAPGALWIETLEGGHIASPGDWIITGVKGERYPCKPDIFDATYEPA